MYKLFLVIIFLVTVTAVEAQSTNYLFYHIGLKDGLNQENMYTIEQDARGFLWIASSNSIQRYDGHRLLNFYTGGKGVLPSGMITSMEMDKKNRLWIVTSFASVGYFDTEKFTYHPVKINLPSAFADTGAGLLIDETGNIILVYVGRGFLTYNENANTISQQNNAFTLPKGYEPRHMIQDADLNYWVATANGFVKYNSKKKILSYGGHNIENDAVINKFGFVKNCGVVYTDRLKRLWISYREPGFSIKSFDPATGETKAWENILDKSLKGAVYDLWGIRQLTDGSLWMNGPGLFAKIIYDQNTIEPVLADASGEYSIRYDVVSNLFEDREKSIWVCTNKGLFRCNPSSQIFRSVNNKVVNADKIITNEVTDILETTDGEILVSTWGEGIFCYDKDFKPIVSKYIDRKKDGELLVWCMMQTSNGDLWRGGQDGVLFIYDAKTKKTKRLSPEVCNKKTIRQIVEDKEGNIWLGTQAGHLIKWNVTDKKFYLQQQFKRLIGRLYVDSYNNIWACTDIDGVYKVKCNNGIVLAHYTNVGAKNKTLLINGASDMIQYDDTTIVIAANGLNILNTTTGNFTYWDEGTQIANIVKDKENNLWLSTNRGIVCRQLDKPWSNIFYDARDGVSNLNFSNSASANLKNGLIAFGTNHDFLVFDPVKAMTFNFNLPDVEISEIQVMNKKLSVDSIRQLGQLLLLNHQNTLTIKYTTNNYQNLSPIEYMIEGIDKDWKNISSNGELNLNYLSAGKYVLKATSRDGLGKIGNITAITLVVETAFYKTWWFYSLLLITICGLLYWWDKERMKRKDAMLQMRTSIANNLHKDVHTALSNINILSEIAKIKADVDPQKSKEFIEQIHNKSQDTVIAMDDMLWTISPENDSMSKMMLRMREFIDEMNAMHGTQMELLVNDNVTKLRLDMQLRLESFLLFKDLLRGVLNAGAKKGKIHVSLEKLVLLYSIEFSNDFIDKQILNNLLHKQDIENRLTKIKASLHLDNYKNISLLRCSIHI